MFFKLNSKKKIIILVLNTLIILFLLINIISYICISNQEKIANPVLDKICTIQWSDDNFLKSYGFELIKSNEGNYYYYEKRINTYNFFSVCIEDSKNSQIRENKYPKKYKNLVYDCDIICSHNLSFLQILDPASGFRFYNILVGSKILYVVEIDSTWNEKQFEKFIMSIR